MKLSENQKYIFYIALTAFLAVGLGIVVFLIVKHFRNNNCTPNCNGKFCGDDGCKGNCGTCLPGQTCGEDGKCSGCPDTCKGKECGDQCKGICGTCLPGQTCGEDGKCSGCPDTCKGKKCGDNGCKGICGTCLPGQTCGEDGKCSGCPENCNGVNCGPDCTDCRSCLPGQTCGKNGKCSGCPDKCSEINCGSDCTDCTGSCPSLQTCNEKVGYCVGNGCPVECNGVNCGPNCKGCIDCPPGQMCDESDNCKISPDAPGQQLSCIGNVCSPYICNGDSCGLRHLCLGNVCTPFPYTCDVSTNCKPIGDGIPVCKNNMCFMEYKNPKDGFYGCQSQEQSIHGNSSAGSNSDDNVQKYCSENEHCVGYYGSSNWNIATDTDPIKCDQKLSSGYDKFFYKQKGPTT